MLGQLRLAAEESGPSGSSGGQGTPHAQLGTARHDDGDGNQREQQEAQGQATPSTNGPQTPEEWVEALVGEMAAATDVDNARARAANILSEFDKWMAVHRQGDIPVCMELGEACMAVNARHAVRIYAGPPAVLCVTWPVFRDMLDLLITCMSICH